MLIHLSKPSYTKSHSNIHVLSPLWRTFSFNVLMSVWTNTCDLTVLKGILEINLEGGQISQEVWGKKRWQTLPVQMKSSNLSVVPLKVREIEEVWRGFLLPGLPEEGGEEGEFFYNKIEPQAWQTDRHNNQQSTRKTALPCLCQPVMLQLTFMSLKALK